jgi:hypothetical protein
MTHWRERFKDSDKYLGSVDLWDGQSKGYKQVTVTIEKFFQDEMVGQMGKEKKVFLKLKEFQKPMVCNVTNMKRLTKVFDSIELESFIGKQVVLGVEKVSSPEGKVDALRFSTRPAKQSASPVAQLKTMDDAGLQKAIKMVSQGAVTIDALKAAYSITPEQLKQLQDATTNA